ncbi:diaminopimelate decarboxylase [Candidatus Vidania fulgoroideorum]
MISNIIKNYKKPIFIYSYKKILKNLKKFRKNKKIRIFYALKSNYNKKIIKKISKIVEGFEVVSIGEIMFLKKLGIKNNLIFSGVSKKKSEIKYAIKNNVSYISVESYSELKKIKGKINIILKYNLDMSVGTKKQITTCKKNNKFGIRKEETIKIINYVKKNKIKIYALGFHLGSQIKKEKYYIKAIKKIFKIIKKYKIKNINNINIGGGYATNYYNNNLIKYKRLLNFIKKKKEKFIIEPGRYIIANSCLTISKVVNIKKSKNKKISILDIGMESIIRPALYGSYHRIINFKIRRKIEKHDIVGPICESTDVFLKKKKIGIKRGDHIIIKDTGAYCLSMRSLYNMRIKPLEIIIYKKKIL